MKKQFEYDGFKWYYGQPFDFVRGKVAHVYKGPCPSCGRPTFDYGGKWACTDWRYCKHSVPQIVCSNGPEPDWWMQ